MSVTKKGIQDELLKAYSNNNIDVITSKVYQEKPNTFVLVTLYPGTDLEVTEFAFSKCSGVTKKHEPDKWDAEYGVSMAVNKAIAKHAKRIIANG